LWHIPSEAPHLALSDYFFNGINLKKKKKDDKTKGYCGNWQPITTAVWYFFLRRLACRLLSSLFIDSMLATNHYSGLVFLFMSAGM